MLSLISEKRGDFSYNKSPCFGWNRGDFPKKISEKGPGIRLLVFNDYHARSSHWKDTPFHWFFWGKTPPILAKTRTFVVRKITPFSYSRIAHCVMTPFKTNWGHSLQYVFFIRFSSCLLLVVVTLEHYISWKCKAIGNNLGTQSSALTWALTLQGLQRNIGPPKNIPFCAISRSWSEKKYPFCHISRSVHGARNPPLSPCF